ncbi:unnamed protein product, partial [Tetraodon nigroviridis]
MSSFGLELTGVSLSVLGWMLSIVTCALPMWRVSAFIGANIVTAQVYWEGLWMSCVFQSTGQMQCKVYDSMLALPPDLQAARALTVVSIIVGLVPSLSQCPIIPTGQKMEIGAALYLGWAASALLLVGGSILCCSCPPREEKTLRYTMPTQSRGAYSAAPRQPLVDITAEGLLLAAQRYKGSLVSAVASLSNDTPCCSPRSPWIYPHDSGNALPMWKVSAFIGANIITAQTIWEGLWMNCVNQSTGQMQCKVYDSMLALSQELQASRAMMIIAIILAVLGVMISIVGAKCTNCIEEEGAKAKVMIIAGIFFILSGILVLIPVSWTANVIIQDFYNPIICRSQRREIGAALYIGWATAALLLIGGAMLCSSCPPKEEKYKPPRM